MSLCYYVVYCAFLWRDVLVWVVFLGREVWCVVVYCMSCNGMVECCVFACIVVLRSELVMCVRVCRCALLCVVLLYDVLLCVGA